MTERWVAVDRVQPEAHAMQRCHDRGHDGRDAQCLGVPVRRCNVDQRPQPELVGGDRQRRADSAERGASRSGQRLEDRDHRDGQSAGRAHRPLERGELGLIRQVAGGDEVPHGLEAVVTGQLDRVVSAVVEPTRLTVDVADRRVGDGDAVESWGYIDEVLGS